MGDVMFNVDGRWKTEDGFFFRSEEEAYQHLAEITEAKKTAVWEYLTPKVKEAITQYLSGNRAAWVCRGIERSPTRYWEIATCGVLHVTINGRSRNGWPVVKVGTHWGAPGLPTYPREIEFCNF